MSKVRSYSTDSEDDDYSEEASYYTIKLPEKQPSQDENIKLFNALRSYYNALMDSDTGAQKVLDIWNDLKAEPQKILIWVFTLYDIIASSENDYKNERVTTIFCTVYEALVQPNYNANDTCIIKIKSILLQSIRDAYHKGWVKDKFIPKLKIIFDEEDALQKFLNHYHLIENDFENTKRELFWEIDEQNERYEKLINKTIDSSEPVGTTLPHYDEERL